MGERGLGGLGEGGGKGPGPGEGVLEGMEGEGRGGRGGSDGEAVSLKKRIGIEGWLGRRKED